MSMKKFGICSLLFLRPSAYLFASLWKDGVLGHPWKIREVRKDKVDYKSLFCFNYVQASDNMELLIKAFGELVLPAAVRPLLGTGKPGSLHLPSSFSSSLQAPLPLPGPCLHVVRLHLCQRNNTQPPWKRLFLELCFRSSLLGSPEGSVHL